MEGLQIEIKRNKELIQQYLEIGNAVNFRIMMIQADIDVAEKTIREGDTVSMVKIYPRLKANK